MVGRFTVTTLLALAFLSPDAASAQQTPYGYAASPYGNPGAMVPAPQYADGVMPAGYGQPVFYGGYMPDGTYCPDPSMYADPAAYCPPDYSQHMTEERLPDDKGWNYDDSPLDVFLTQAVKNSWIRLEYLNWDIKNPGNVMLGAPLQGNNDPRVPFPVTIVDPTDPLGNPIQIGTARVPELGEINLQNRNGIRGTLGIPLTVGASIEANYFQIENTTANITVEDLPTPDTPGALVFLATSTFTNGALGTNTFLYDTAFDAHFSSKVLGSEVNVIMDAKVPGNGFKIRPLAGFRYMGIDEGLKQRGVFSQIGFGVGTTLDPPLVSTIDSRSRSSIFAPQIGLRTEFVTNWFTIGVEPKIAFGVDYYEATVRTENLRFDGDPTVFTKETGTGFSPIGEIQVYGQVRLNDNISLFVSYDLILAGRIARPFSNIFYNDLGVGAAESAIVVDPDFEEFFTQGLTVGGEIRFK